MHRTKTTRTLLCQKEKYIPLFKVFMPKGVMKPLGKILFSGFIGEGPTVEEFEERLAPWFNNKNVLALNNGTAALQLALRLANVGYNDEVISSPMTCSATNHPILAMGADIVWADINPWTGNIDPSDVRKKITRRTKAIMCMHWGGYPCDLNELNATAKKHNIALIEDACHAFGSTYHGKAIGSHSDFACFSFQAIKEMTTVDGGALTCKSKNDCKRGRLLRWYGIDRRIKGRDLRCEIDILEYGYKFHMNNVTATIGIEQLKHINKTLHKHQHNAGIYNQALKNLKNIHLLRYQNDRTNAHWLYTIRVNNIHSFMEYMKKKKIAVSQVHARNDNHTAFRRFKTKLPGVDEFSSEQVSIPVGWWLKEQDINYIIDSIYRYDHSAR